MSRIKNQGIISFPLVIFASVLLAQSAVAAGPSTTALLAAVSKIPYQAGDMPITKQKTVTNNQGPLIHDDVWVAERMRDDRRPEPQTFQF